MKKIDKHYVSDIDQKMTEFDARHAKSAAQQAEIDKYQKIYQKRDVPMPVQPMDDEIWN